MFWTSPAHHQEVQLYKNNHIQLCYHHKNLFQKKHRTLSDILVDI